MACRKDCDVDVCICGMKITVYDGATDSCTVPAVKKCVYATGAAYNDMSCAAI